jgi:hypothetical protein
MSRIVPIPFRGALVAALAVVAVMVFVSASRSQVQEKEKAVPAAAPKTSSSAASVNAEKTVPVVTKAGLGFSVSDTWKVEPPTSSMRQAQVAIPKVEGDSEGAELVVFHFGSREGGSIQENLDRWYAQFEGPDGKPPTASAKVEKRDVGGLAVTTVDVSGRYVAAVRPGAPERHDKPNFRMLAAVVTTPGGNFFFKLVGPAKTVEANEKRFQAAIDGVKFTAPGGH